MQKIVVLGGGLVGREVARDLSERFHVTAVDSSQERMDMATAATSVDGRVADLSNPSDLASVIESAEVVVGALRGALESLNTDGLRTLATTMRCPNMKEKTLRYPYHGRFMEALRQIGFFDKEAIDVEGVSVSPLAFTSALMFPHWTFKEGEEEFTVMRIVIEGVCAEGREERITYNLLDRYDKKRDVTSMARTTGYMCTAGVHLLADGMFSRKGVCPPEYVGEDPVCTEFIVNHLESRGVLLDKAVTPSDVASAV